MSAPEPMNIPPSALQIETHEDGARIGTNGKGVTIRLEPANGRIFKRRAIKGAGSAAARMVEWLVVELDAVKVYVDGTNVVVTYEDRNP